MTNDEARGSDLLTTQEVAKVLGIAEKTIYAWRKQGIIEPIPGNPAKKKQPRYYRRKDVEWILHGGRLTVDTHRRAS